jgi:hypothetical protein
MSRLAQRQMEIPLPLINPKRNKDGPPHKPGKIVLKVAD